MSGREGNLELGRRGEDIACAHMEERGYEILSRNYRTRSGEIDLVARKGELTVFVEVKSRRSLNCGEPVEAVTTGKARRLRRLAGEYLSTLGGTADVRFDVVSVLFDPRGPGHSIEHIPDAF